MLPVVYTPNFLNTFTRQQTSVIGSQNLTKLSNVTWQTLQACSINVAVAEEDRRDNNDFANERLREPQQSRNLILLQDDTEPEQ